MRDLCPWCQARHDRALNHDLHATPESRARLHADLARVCDPRYCPPVTNAVREPR